MSRFQNVVSRVGASRPLLRPAWTRPLTPLCAARSIIVRPSPFRAPLLGWTGSPQRPALVTAAFLPVPQQPWPGNFDRPHHEPHTSLSLSVRATRARRSLTNEWGNTAGHLCHPADSIEPELQRQLDRLAKQVGGGRRAAGRCELGRGRAGGEPDRLVCHRPRG